MGIKFNIETLYLPDEMFKQAGATFDLYIGDPVPHYMLVNGMSHREWCARIRKECYKLPDKKYLQ